MAQMNRMHLDASRRADAGKVAHLAAQAFIHRTMRKDIQLYLVALSWNSEGEGATGLRMRVGLSFSLYVPCNL